MNQYIRCATVAVALAVLSCSTAQAAPPPPPPSPVPTGFFVSASIDGIYSHRNDVSGPIVVPIGGVGTVIDANDFPFADRGGYDARLRVGFAQWSLEGRYLGGFHWNSSVPDLGAVGNVRIGSFSNFGATNLTGAEQSKFDSWEANFRWQVLPWLTPFAGYRQIKMSDQTDLTITFPAFSAVYSFGVPWEARGAQIGAEVRLLGPGTTWQPGPFYVDLDGRIGLYHVTADTIFSLVPSTGGFFGGGSSFSKNNSMIYELGATLGYQIMPNWDVHAGYRFLSIRDALFAGDYAAAATAQSSQNIVPGARELDLHMVMIGTRVSLP